MPRSFEMATDYDATVEQVHAAMRAEQYWLARLDDSGADEARLDRFTTTSDGGVDVVTTQVLYPDRLPGFVRQVHRGELAVVREETWGPVGDGRAAVTVRGSVPSAPVRLHGSGTLAAAGAGSRLTFTATVEVRIPLLGGRLEEFIGGQLMQLLIAEQRFTTAWIRRTA
ncbi:DUF2505 domain-containing protein [uncultured Mycolicibacterium sp.]|uniref:DUF2505 domain-containing protein n=1 Tax=uncultured Mycolicibacterium sp. TaxID=2320817 RepID=UPI00262FADDD|nr:DUF2505 domain-containing protein [uncultured Mycolicibacterium sp.]